ncbi:hypothetical protein [Nocardia sp. NPDC058705]|uniref:hypothetical protein n=1 Tax=Nocardia sp. NPDC058705 TaxID=3346609 RepID=UPI0036B3FA6A
MSITGIASARHKLARADHHISDLEQQIRAFTEANRIGVQALSQPSRTHPGELDCEMIVQTEPPEVPDGWSLVAGDALTCLRAALDHSVFPHARQFPTLTSDVDKNGKPVKIGTILSPEVTVLVRQHQPYVAEPHTPHHHPIGALSNLVNMDKHRQLLVTNNFTAQVMIRPSDDYEITSEVPQRGDALARGDVLTRFRVKPIGLDARLEYVNFLVAEPAIDLPNTDDYRPLIKLLWDMHAAVGGIIDQLAEAGVP